VIEIYINFSKFATNF